MWNGGSKQAIKSVHEKAQSLHVRLQLETHTSKLTRSLLQTDIDWIEHEILRFSGVKFKSMPVSYRKVGCRATQEMRRLPTALLG